MGLDAGRGAPLRVGDDVLLEPASEDEAMYIGRVVAVHGDAAGGPPSKVECQACI